MTSRQNDVASTYRAQLSKLHLTTLFN